jgi:hypothetical protein
VLLFRLVVLGAHVRPPLVLAHRPSVADGRGATATTATRARLLRAVSVLSAKMAALPLSKCAMFSLSVQRDGYLLVIVSGKGTLATYCAVVAFVAELVERERNPRVLVDPLGSEPALSPQEHRELGEQVGRLWNHTQVAVVVPSTERVLIGEQAAQARGAHISTFTDLHAAGDWLKEPACG